jgi:hypothetical protein
MPSIPTIVKKMSLFFIFNEAKVNGIVMPVAVIAILVSAMAGIEAPIIHWNKLLFLLIEYSTAKIEHTRAAVILCGASPVAEGRIPVNSNPVLIITVTKSVNTKSRISSKKPFNWISLMRFVDMAIPIITGQISMILRCNDESPEKKE